MYEVYFEFFQNFYVGRLSRQTQGSRLRGWPNGEIQGLRDPLNRKGGLIFWVVPATPHESMDDWSLS